MDETTEVFNNFCNQLAEMARGARDLSSFYLWSDKRVGSVTERFQYDAKRFWELQKLGGSYATQ